LIEIGSKAAEKISAQTNRQTDRHYDNNGHLAVNQQLSAVAELTNPRDALHRGKHAANEGGLSV